MEPLREFDLSKISLKRQGAIKKKVLIGGGFAAFLLGLFVLYLHLSYPTASPLVSGQDLVGSLGHSHTQLKKEVIGFLPYWTLDNSKYIRFDVTSEVIFFSLSADENGQIVKVVNGQTDPGWRWWSSDTIQNLIAKTQISGSKMSLTIAMQKNDTLEKFLDNPAAQQTLITNLLGLVKANNLNGINIDFEYDGDPGQKYRDEFTTFNTNLTKTFRAQSPQTELSIDFFPLSVRKVRLYDIPKLAPLFDKVIVMAYDFYGSNSDVAGPIAPVYGYKDEEDPTKAGNYVFDLNTTYQDYLKVVPAEKLIMGVPYYGWDWPVEDGATPMSNTLEQNDQNGYPEVLSYGRMKTDTDLKESQCSFDALAKEPWCYYTDSNGIAHQVWYENEQSIGIKFDLVNINNISGIAIWTLGYDKEYPDLWDLITKDFGIK